MKISKISSNLVKNLLAFVVGSLLLLNSALAVVTPIKEGVDYTLLTTPVTATVEPQGKVSVKEFFSFTCIHCKVVDPIVEKVLLPNKKIDLNKIQVVWNGDISMISFAKLNATLQMLNLNKLYVPAFNAIFANQNLADPEVLKQFLAANGLTKDQVDQFMSTYNSFAVSTKVTEYTKMTTNYAITGTPTFIVGDKYVVKPASPARLVEVTQMLVNKISSGK